MANKGEMTSPVKLTEGNEEVIAWQNADVELPIHATEDMANG